MLPATAPFYMGIAAGWAVLVGAYVQHTGARKTFPIPLMLDCLVCACVFGWKPVTRKGSEHAEA